MNSTTMLDDTSQTESQIDYDQAIQAFNQVQRAASKLSTLSKDVEAPFDLVEFLTGRILKNRSDPLPKLGVILKDVEVYGMGSCKQKKINTVLSSVTNSIKSLLTVKKGNFRKKKILHKINAFVKEGEMMLVLGKPGSGCTSLLKTIGNNIEHFADITGEIKYGGLSNKEIKQKFKGEVAYNQEDDEHYSTLTVEQTLRFAIKTKIPRNTKLDFKEIEEQVLNMLLKVFALEKCKDTLVGDAILRGISGGEKKRVSIAEQISTRCLVGAWDGSTKGLDSASALDYIKSLRIMTDLLFKTTIVTIYQASEDIYNLFDKVLLLHEGRCIYFGPANQAKQYFVDLGFYCPPRSTTADFLTSVTDSKLTTIKEGMESKVPRTSEELEKQYIGSTMYSAMKHQLETYEKEIKNSNSSLKFKELAYNERGYVKKSSNLLQKISGPYNASWFGQFKACFVRELQLWIGNRVNLYTKLFLNISLAFITGGVFYRLPVSSGGAFTRVGALYFALLFNVLLSLAELPKAVSGRPIVYKQKAFAMYSTSAHQFAQIFSDFPIYLFQVLIYSVVFYWMSGMQTSASKFFVFVFVIFLTTVCNSAMFRALSNVAKDLSIAQLISNIVVVLMLLYNGYLIPYKEMKPWFVWFYYINHVGYAFKALVGNEFRNLKFPCIGKDLVPYGPSYTDVTYQVCTLKGAVSGSGLVDGLEYLNSAYDINGELRWVQLNILIVFCFWIVFVTLAITLMNLISFGKGGYTENIYKRTKRRIQTKYESTEKKENSFEAPFWFKDVNYYVGKQNSKKQLLHNIQGYVNPGSLVALMGASGAGKTTLLNYLSFKESGGHRDGSVFLGDKKFTSTSASQIGYCQQMDVHNPTATVKEALKFSAYLRQGPEVPKTEKDSTVDEIIQLLELEDIEDAMIGSVETGQGISLEARKKLSIGIELVAKPQVLFLDEPTSGLDSHASLMIVKFLQKLAASGKSILCTIHQPSAVLFEHFDSLVLLARGGYQVYAGPIGNNSSIVLDYFHSNGGYRCDPEANSAEYVINVVGGSSKSSNIDWIKVWDQSPQRNALSDKTKALTPSEITFVEPKTKPSLLNQIKLVFGRMMVSYWRSPTYNLSRYFNQIAVSLLLGLSFLRLGNDFDEFQNRVFAIFQAVVLVILILIAVQPQYFIQKRWFLRETKSGFYDWKSFSFSIMTAEMPFSITASTIYFFIFYYLVGLNTLSGRTWYFYISYVVFCLFAISLGQLISAIAPNLMITSTLNPFFSVNMALFSGVSISYSAMPDFFKYWLYWLDPYHYVIEGIIANEISGIEIKCLDKQLLKIPLPQQSSTCDEYLLDFLNTATGYLAPNTTKNECLYCPYRTGDDYLNTLSWSFDNRWRNFGVIVLFWIFNIICIFIILRRKYKF